MAIRSLVISGLALAAALIVAQPGRAQGFFSFYEMSPRQIVGMSGGRRLRNSRTDGATRRRLCLRRDFRVRTGGASYRQRAGRPGCGALRRTRPALARLRRCATGRASAAQHRRRRSKWQLGRRQRLPPSDGARRSLQPAVARLRRRAPVRLEIRFAEDAPVAKPKHHAMKKHPSVAKAPSTTAPTPDAASDKPGATPSPSVAAVAPSAPAEPKKPDCRQDRGAGRRSAAAPGRGSAGARAEEGGDGKGSGPRADVRQQPEAGRAAQEDQRPPRRHARLIARRRCSTLDRG